MDISLQVARFLYRIRYKVLLPSVFVALVVVYVAQFLPKEYTVVASVFTGIASNKGLDENVRNNYLELANTFDNVINYTKSKGSLEGISLKLIAQSLMYGSVIKDNKYISAKHYISLLEITPKEVLSLVDGNSLDTTLSNFNEYRKSSGDGNFFHQIYNSPSSHYSYKVLNTIRIHRVHTSDLIDLSYTSNDPGMTSNTVSLITDELIKSHHTFSYKSSDEVALYYEKELAICKSKLNVLEDEFMNYNVKYKIINYDDQTKELAATISDFELRYEQALIEYARSTNLIETLGTQLAVRNKLYNTNEEFLEALDRISSIRGKIYEVEMFNLNGSLDNLNEEAKQHEELAVAEMNIKDLSSRIHQVQYSKEGVVLDDIVRQWLEATINLAKAEAELEVLEKRRIYYEMQRSYYSPVGTQISRMEREINIVEESYLNILHHLGVARQNINSIRLESSSPEIVTPATFPLSSNERKRSIFILLAFVATLMFITCFEILLEVVDRTLRDPLRASKLTALEVVGALLGHKQFRERGYIRDHNRISARTICNKFNHFLHSKKTVYINIISIKNDEGKSFVTQCMKSEWEKQALVVETLDYRNDFLCDAKYLRAQSFDFFTHKPADVVFIVYPPCSENSIPLVFLREASVNILVANAGRGWKTSDDEYVKTLHKDIMNNEILLILNNTNRDYVEDLVGNLSADKEKNSVGDNLKWLAFTSDANGVK